MKAMDKDDAKLAVEGINSLFNYFSRALSAYETKKKLEVVEQELKDKKDLEKWRLDNIEREIAAKHNAFEMTCNLIDKSLDSLERSLERSSKQFELDEIHYRNQSNKILSIILRYKGCDEQFTQFVKLWERVEACLEKSIMNRVNDANRKLSDSYNNAKMLLAKTHSNCIGFSARRQIGLEE